ncbi:hypothetical protein L7F22_024469 [Adiantum nelumboides]|nr:hypothetical protein [Adiantum nelumboides]
MFLCLLIFLSCAGFVCCMFVWLIVCGVFLLCVLCVYMRFACAWWGVFCLSVCDGVCVLVCCLFCKFVCLLVVLQVDNRLGGAVTSHTSTFFSLCFWDGRSFWETDLHSHSYTKCHFWLLRNGETFLPQETAFLKFEKKRIPPPLLFFGGGAKCGAYTLP